MYKKAFVYISLLFSINCNEKTSCSLPYEGAVTAAKGYPRWLKEKEYSTRQTSGITFIGRDENNLVTFLLADDVGKIHHLKIKEDTIFFINPVSVSSSAKNFLGSFPKADFEDIAYDKFSRDVYISIEGNSPDPKKYTGIYKINFENNSAFSDSILSFQKVTIHPENLFLKHIDDNIGYEGLAVDSNYLYLGLEGFKNNDLFSDSSLILIISKRDLKIMKSMRTADLGIHTICGLYSHNDKDIIGIDRNKRRLFRLLFDENLSVKKVFTKDLKVNIPSFPAFTYVASLESVSMDDEGNIFLVDDPWEQFFIPSGEILQKLDSASLKNFNKYIPIIYKYKFRSAFAYEGK
jgi:hypothetical protein